jgi:peroxiredoxin
MAWPKKDLFVVCLLAGLTSLLVYRLVPYFSEHNVEVGDRAPDFNLSSETGTGLSLSDYAGKKFVLLNFWATWCPPCIEEMPSLNRVHEMLRDQGLVVLGVSVDEDEEAYKRFLSNAGVSFPTARDPERTVSTRYGTFKYPETYLINPEGKVIRKYVGPENWERPEVLNYLRSLL